MDRIFFGLLIFFSSVCLAVLQEMIVPTQLGKWGQALGAPEGVISLQDVTLIQQSVVGQDKDQDGVSDNIDNCPIISNKYQTDSDEDGEGDACEAPEANGFWLDFDNPDTMIHIYGLYFHPTNTQAFIAGVPATDISVLDSAHIVVTVPNGQLIEPITITVTTSNGSDNTPDFATLIDRGGGLIYDTELKVTWLQDANYASTSGFDTDGFMTWPVAMSWAAGLSYYDSVRDKTWNDWRLPSALNKDGSGPCFAFECINSEMGHLYYINHINQASPGPFHNLKFGSYWSGTGRAPLPGTAWVFTTGTGKQDFSGPLEETLGSYAWAVRDGDVAASVPSANNDSFSITNGLTVNINLSLNDTGSDDVLDLASINIVNGPSNGHFESINIDGSVDYQHNGSDTVADSFTYTINDINDVTSNVASVGIKIYPNKAPVANDDSGVVYEGETANFDLAANDSDDDSGLDLASIRLTSMPTNGSVVINKDGSVDYTEVMVGTSSDSFSYTINDISGATSNVASVDILVKYPNLMPVANNDNGTVDEGETVNLDLAANDSDDDNGLDLASITLIGRPTNGSVVINKDGTVDYMEVVPGAASDSFSYVISDLAGAISNTAVVTIKVDAVAATLSSNSNSSGGSDSSSGGLQPPLLILILLSFLFRGFITPGRKMQITR